MLPAYVTLLLPLPFVRRAISAAMEDERAFYHLRLICGSEEEARIYADLAREQHAAEVAEAIHRPQAPRSLAEILQEKVMEAAALAPAARKD